MAKELPYFQFEPAEYLTKDISFCSLEAQGLFINICSYYWQRNCELTREQVLRRLNYPDALNELISEGIIDLQEDKITIKFLDNQRNNAITKSEINAKNGAKGGRPKKPKETEIKANKNPSESESKGIRKDKIKEEEIRLENIREKNRQYAIKNCLPTDNQKNEFEEFLSYWFEIGMNDKKHKFEKQKSFNWVRRWNTWLKNNEKWNKEKSSAKKESDNFSISKIEV